MTATTDKQIKASIGLGLASGEITGTTRGVLKELLLESDPEFLAPEAPGSDINQLKQEWYERIERILEGNGDG